MILCDVMMPGMTGVDLHRALERDQPDLALRMVFMTAGTVGSTQAGLDALKNEVLAKPVDLSSIRAAIARVLASTAASPPR